MIAWFTRHPTAANLMMGALMLLGLITLPNLQRESLPEIKNDKVEIRVIYKGATAEEVEDAICRRLEDALEGVTDLDEIRCEAREGIGQATAVMLEGADMTRFLDDVKSEVETIDDFPRRGGAAGYHRAGAYRSGDRAGRHRAGGSGRTEGLCGRA